jgi:hypothetical protein
MPTLASIAIATCRRLGARLALVQAHRLGDLIADGEHRVERRHRLLEDHADAIAADRAHVLLGQRQQILAGVADAAAGDAPGRRRHQPHDRQRGDRLAAARLADDAERRAARHRERDAVDRAHRAPIGAELRDQVTDLQQGLGHRDDDSAAGRAPRHGAPENETRRPRSPRVVTALRVGWSLTDHPR